jgi:hypothetical protein
VGRPLGREQLGRRWPQEWQQEPRGLQLLDPEVEPRPLQLPQARPRQERLGQLVQRQQQEQLPVPPQQQLPLVLQERRHPALPEPQPEGAAQLLRQLRWYPALRRL